jgi:hypothetical protein
LVQSVAKERSCRRDALIGLLKFRKSSVDFLQQLVGTLIFGADPRLFEIASRLVMLLLHWGQHPEVEIDAGDNDAALAQLLDRGRLLEQSPSATCSEEDELRRPAATTGRNRRGREQMTSD